MAKEIIFNSEIREKTLCGINKVTDTIKVTLGPMGRNVVIQNKGGSPIITNDGAIIAEAIELKDRFEEMGLQIIKEVAAKTNEWAGDGTTAAILLTQYMIQEGMKDLVSGANPIELKKGILGAVQVADIAIQKLAQPIRTQEDITRVATISSNDSEIGEIISEAMEKIGKEGVITVEESKITSTSVDIREGMQIDRGFLSPLLNDSENMIVELDEPYILVTDQEISDARELVPILEQVAQEEAPLLIIAEDVNASAMRMLMINKNDGILNTVIIRPPAYGDGRRDIMEDIAIMTGGTFITSNMGHVLRETTLDMLGCAASVRVEKNRTVIVDGYGDEEAVAGRIAYLRKMIELTDYEFNKERLEERLAKFVSGVAVISVGAFTETEIKEKKLHIENALCAAKAAVAEGIVPGGGVALINISADVKAYTDTLSGDKRTGAAIVLNALEKPMRQIAENAGLNGGDIVTKVQQCPPGVGFNVMTEEYINMIEVGIIDSAKVTRLALQNAASATAMLLTTEAGVANIVK